MFQTQFYTNLDTATNHLRLEPDWPTILLICDNIRQKDISPKKAINEIKKRMQSNNPHTAYYALLVLESVVKNCGVAIHDEIATMEFCKMFITLFETTTHENVKNKMLELIQAWAYAFRSSEKHESIVDTFNIIRTSGYEFPVFKVTEAMFSADTAPEWANGRVCHRCRTTFSITIRKHHCRNCGQIFCALCTQKQSTIPKYGFEKEVRVCDGCFENLQKSHTSSGTSNRSTNPNNNSELPAEYLGSSLAQQSQTPQRKTDAELKEEEELQLALALSQSEAEQKNRMGTKTNYRSLQKLTIDDQTPTSTATIIQNNNNNNNNMNNMTKDETVNPELAKYLNRDFWENRKMGDSPISPSAPSPMIQQINQVPLKNDPNDIEIDDFSHNMRTQVEIFVNRMKSNSSRGRSISNDSSVQTLFMNLTSLHSRLLAYIKEMDDKRMWFEQLQDKLSQVKDSRAALDVLRQEHLDKLRLIAEEMERQRQMQMAQKLEIMRKKKQEYLQYQRQLALQRIQEQEREMLLRQEQQKALYKMGGQVFSFMPPGGGLTTQHPHHLLQQQQQQHGSPIHQQMMAGNGVMSQQYGYSQMAPNGQMIRFGPSNMVPPMGTLSHPQQQQQQPSNGQSPMHQTMQGYGQPQHQQQQQDNNYEMIQQNIMHQHAGGATAPGAIIHQQQQQPSQDPTQMNISNPSMDNNSNMFIRSPFTSGPQSMQQHQHQPSVPLPPPIQQLQQQQPQQIPSHMLPQPQQNQPTMQPPSNAQQPSLMPPQNQPQQQPPTQPQPQPLQQQVENNSESVENEVKTAELISFD